MSNEIVWRDNFSDARQEAESQSKFIFIDWAGLPSCVGCVSLETTTYPEKDVIDFCERKLYSGSIKPKAESRSVQAK